MKILAENSCKPLMKLGFRIEKLDTDSVTLSNSFVSIKYAVDPNDMDLEVLLWDRKNKNIYNVLSLIGWLDSDFKTEFTSTFKKESPEYLIDNANFFTRMITDKLDRIIKGGEMEQLVGFETFLEGEKELHRRLFRLGPKNPIFKKWKKGDLSWKKDIREHYKL